MKAAIWGAGGIAGSFLTKRVLYSDYEVLFIVDNDRKKWGKVLNSFPVVSPERLYDSNIDVVIVCSVFLEEIRQQILLDKNMDIDPESILSYKQLENMLTIKLCNLYKNSSDYEIKSIINEFEEYGFNIYGKFRPELGIRYDVLRDSENWPYVLFDNKRMYFPYAYSFKIDSDGEFVDDILMEQQTDSPHLYLRDDSDIPNGGVIVDAGVCEGNFGLRYIDRARKMYLIESDERWYNALIRTFRPYSDKIVLCNKSLGGENSKQVVTLDSLVKENIDFLKMDIEGGEIEALKGAVNVLGRSMAKCAICSYHKYGDEEKIKNILSECGYTTSTSKGYMFFVYDPDMSNTMDFRRGIVYGDKR